MIRMPPFIGANVSSPMMGDRTKVNLSAQELCDILEIQKRREKETRQRWHKSPAGIAANAVYKAKDRNKWREAQRAKREAGLLKIHTSWTPEETALMITLLQEQKKVSEETRLQSASKLFSNKKYKICLVEWRRLERKLEGAAEGLKKGGQPWKGPIKKKERPFACEIEGCPKSYVSKKILREHGEVRQIVAVDLGGRIIQASDCQDHGW